MEPEQVEVRFVTTLPEELRITEAPFRVPVSLNTVGLNGVINHLLSLSESKSFNFLINGEFLTATLSAYLREKELSTEITLVIEYVETVQEPDPQQNWPLEDWVSCVDVFQGRIFAACYDGMARIWRDGASNSKKVMLAGHEGPVKQICALREQGLNQTVVTGGMDKTVRVWNAVDEGVAECVAIGRLGDGIGALSVGPSESVARRFASGDMSGTLTLWDVGNLTASGADVAFEGSKKNPKKRRTTPASSAELQHLDQAPATHNGAIAAVEWTREDTVLTGGSFDNTIRVFDIAGLRASTSFSTSFGVFSLGYNHRLQLIGSGHSDGIIRLWDPRQQQRTLQSLIDKSSAGVASAVVSSVKWHPHREYILVSGSYDGIVRMWDIRSSRKALHKIKLGKDKVFSVHWSFGAAGSIQAEEAIVAGGADGKVKKWACSF